jgi:hypothetical protein
VGQPSPINQISDENNNLSLLEVAKKKYEAKIKTISVQLGEDKDEVLKTLDVLYGDLNDVIKGLTELDTAGISKLPVGIIKNLKQARDELTQLKLFDKEIKDRKLTNKQIWDKNKKKFEQIDNAENYIQKALVKLN